MEAMGERLELSLGRCNSSKIARWDRKKDEKETKEEEEGREELEREMVCIANSLPLQTRGPKKASASPHNDKSISVPLPRVF